MESGGNGGKLAQINIEGRMRVDDTGIRDGPDFTPLVASFMGVCSGHWCMQLVM